MKKSTCFTIDDDRDAPTRGFNGRTEQRVAFRDKAHLDAMNQEKQQKNNMKKRVKISEGKAGNKYHRQIAEEGRKKEEAERKKEEAGKTNKIRAEVFKEKLLNRVLDKAAKKKLMGGGGGSSSYMMRGATKCHTCGGAKRTMHSC